MDGSKGEAKPVRMSSRSNVALKKQAVRQKIERYFQQLTQGCHRENCTNPNCASNPAQPKMSGNEAAIEAIKLLNQKAEICLVIKNNTEPRKNNLMPLSTQRITSGEAGSTPMDFKEADPESSHGIVMDTMDQLDINSRMSTKSESGHPESSGLAAATKVSKEFIPKNVPAFSLTNMDGKTEEEGGHDTKKIEVKEVKYLTEDIVNDLLEQCKREEEKRKNNSVADEKQDTKDPYLPLVKIIGEVFSNVESLNRSFLRKQEISPLKPLKVCHTTEELKMDVDHVPDTSVKAESDQPAQDTDIAGSSEVGTNGPFMSFLNSLVNGASDVDTILDMPDSSGRNLLVPNVGENSGLRRTGAVKQKLSKEKPKPVISTTVMQPTVDVQAVRRVYGKLMGIEKVERALANSLEILSLNVEVQFNILHQLQKDKKFSNTNVDLNMFLIVMENPSLHSPEYLEFALPGFYKAMTALPLQAQASLAKWWSAYNAEALLKMVQCVHGLLTFKVLSLEISKNEHADQMDLHKNSTIMAAVKCLRILYYASLLGGEVDKEYDSRGDVKSMPDRMRGFTSLMGLEDEDDIDGSSKAVWKDPLSKELGITSIDSIRPLVEPEEFENEMLNSSFDVYKDFTLHMVGKNGSDHFTFMHYPFILNTLNKTAYLFYDNKIQMLSGRRMMVLQSIIQGSALSPYLRLKIRRDHVVDDSLVRLELIAEENPLDLRKQLYVEFEGEQGVDEGGLSKEFFQLVVEQIFNPDYGMFTYNEATNLFWFNAHSLENKAQFTLIGVVLGLAIYNNCILDIKFPPLIYKKLLGKKARFDDMKDSHPVIYSSLKQLLEYEGDVEEDMMATFGIGYHDMFGISHTHELKVDGANCPVTKENREEYVWLYSDWLLNESISEQFSAFRRGFELVVSKSPLKYMFRPEELEILISGSQEYDFRSLESTTDYDGGFTKESRTVVDFWSVVHDMSEEDKRKLLQFTTGTDRAPVGGLAQIKLVIARNGPDSERLPAAHTCFNVILLPDYKNRDKLKERLHKAITYSKGFGML